MALPKIGTQTFSLNLPISKTKVEYRPFLIGEENAFIMALDSKDQVNIITSFKKLLQNCIVNLDIDVETLPLPEFLFLLFSIRAKSKGEEIEVTKKCIKCDKTFDSVINIIKSLKWRNKENTSKVLQINEDLSLEISLPNADTLMNDQSEDEIKNSLKIIGSSIKKVIYKDEVFKDFSIEELIDSVLNNLTEGQIKQIVESIETLASIYIDVNLKCPFCGNENREEVEDLFDFFT